MEARIPDPSSLVILVALPILLLSNSLLGLVGDFSASSAGCMKWAEIKRDNESNDAYTIKVGVFFLDH